MAYYIVVVYDAGKVPRVLRVLSDKASVLAVAMLVDVSDARILGGVRMVDKDNVAILRGYLPLPEKPRSR